MNSMKRRWAVLLTLVMVLVLPACGRDYRQIQGVVTEVQLSQTGELTAFVVRTWDGEETGVLLTEDTRAVPAEPGGWTTSEMRAEFQKDLMPDVQVSAGCQPKKRTLSVGDSREITAYQAEHITITGHLERGAAALRDGTAIDLLDEGCYTVTHTYCLPDGTQLLQVRGPSGPEGHYVGNLESFDDLSQRAREKILAYYEAQGTLYDETEELEAAYAGWQKNGDDFRCRVVEQSVSPSASGEKVMYFRTDVTLPLDHGDSCTAYTLSLGAAFDRETGEYLSLWDLFRCSQEEARRAIIDAALDWPGSGSVRAEMEYAFSPERVIFSPDGLSMDYEPGSMPSQEHGYIFDARLDSLKELMYDWAVPEQLN